MVSLVECDNLWHCLWFPEEFTTDCYLNGCVLHEKPPVLSLFNFIPWKSFVCPCHCHSCRVRFLWFHAWSRTIQSSLRLNPVLFLPTYSDSLQPISPMYSSLLILAKFSCLWKFRKPTPLSFMSGVSTLLCPFLSVLLYPINSASSYSSHGLFARIGWFSSLS